MFKVATGYASKIMCSGIFVEGLSRERVKRMELSSFPLNGISVDVDTSTQTVTCSLLGNISQKAHYIKGVGTTLYPEGRQPLPNRIPIKATEKYSHSWPLGWTITDRTAANIDITGLKKHINNHFTKESKAVIVIKNGYLITEKYAEGLTDKSPQLGWSMSKSLLNAFIGILVQKQNLDIYQPVPIEEWQTDPRKNISLHHLLQMSSGLNWDESYSKTKLSDVSKMLYLKNDMFAFARSKNSVVPPDSLFTYSSGTTNLIAGLSKSYFPDYISYYQFIQNELFNQIGMNNSLIETDAVGTPVFSSYGYCSARDWAKFGLLYLNNGHWNGEQILPEWWVQYSTTPARQSNGTYGAHFWLNHSHELLPDMPKDVFLAKGFRQQRLFIIPSEQLIVVSLNSSDEDLDFNTYLKDMMQYFK